ncbi:MAG: hypothetical protein SOI52_01590 [Erysipelotrichaceae bacterium]
MDSITSMSRCSIVPCGAKPSFLSLLKTAEEAGIVPAGDVSFVLFQGSCACGICTAYKKDGAVIMSLWMEERLQEEDRRRFIHLLDQRLERIYRPECIETEPADHLTEKALRGCLYFRCGRDYRRPVETWRQSISPSVFDNEGYIINQGAMKDLPFGWFSTREKGCGWIAVYNLMKWYGKEPFLKETAEGLARHAILGEVGGENVVNMILYLRNHGVPVRVQSGTQKMLTKAIHHSHAGILLYNHPYGSHYAAYETAGSEKYHFWNAVYGRREDVLRIEDFYDRRVMVPLGTVLYLD